MKVAFVLNGATNDQIKTMKNISITDKSITVKKLIGTQTIARRNIDSIEYEKGLFKAIIAVVFIFPMILSPIGTIRLFKGDVCVHLSLYDDEKVSFWLNKVEYKEFIRTY